MFSIKTAKSLSHPDPEVRAKRQTFLYAGLMLLSLVWLYFEAAHLFALPQPEPANPNQVLADWSQGTYDIARPLLLLAVAASLLLYVVKVRALPSGKKLKAGLLLFVGSLCMAGAFVLASQTASAMAIELGEEKLRALGFKKCGNIDVARKSSTKSGTTIFKHSTYSVYQPDCSAVDIDFSNGKNQMAVRATKNPEIPLAALTENDPSSSLGLKLCSSVSSAWANTSTAFGKDAGAIYLQQANYRGSCE